jgi:hypothetical protein
MQVDILGVENICKYIEATKYSKFTISKYSNTTNGNYISVFDLHDSNSNENAVNTFRNWAEFMNNNIPYKIICFDDMEITTDANGNEKKIKKGNKTGKSSITFSLGQGQNNNFASASNKEHNDNSNFDLVAFRKEIIKDIYEEREKNEILEEIKRLNAKFAEIEEEEEEEEETPQGIAGIDANQLTQIMGLVNLFKNQVNPSLNGVETPELSTQKENINKAIKILYKNNKNLDTDLLKLAELSETKPDTFNMLLSTLRGM